VNDEIGKSFGRIPGIIASAISGATFLAVGDHYMLRQKLLNSNFIESTKYFLDKKAFFIGFKAITLR
jgi:Na+/citrate or Na+/malate symporter